MSRAILFLLRMYKRGISPLLGNRCRFHPSCSDYARIAIARFGPARGGWLALRRLARCHPFTDGGVEPVPMTFPPRHDREPHPHD
jgi:putative membrane protein insertion efficiency factor